MIFSFAATAFAADQTAESVVSASGAKLTLGAKLIPRGWYFKNITNDIDAQGLPADSQSQALYSSNVYLTVEGKIADNVTGMVELESAYGTSTNSGVYYWGTLDAKPNAQMRIRQAWIQYIGSGLLGIPTGVKVGHFPVSLGEKVFLDLTRFGTDGILLFANPMKELTLVLHTLKIYEDSNFALGGITHANDIDIYGILGTYALDKANTLGLHFTWVKSDIAGYDPEALDTYNLGIHGNGKIAGLSYAAEADFQFGELTNTTVDDTDFKGWAVLAKLGYMIDPVNIRGSFAMGSGAEDADDIEEFQAVVGTDATGAIARYTHYTLVYERCVRTAAIQQVLTGNVRTTGLANTTYFNLGLDVSPIKELSISLDGYLLQATETDLWEEEVGNSVDDELGWEVDAKLSYKITKNLSYFIEAGFFKAGDFYEDAFGIDSETSTMAVHGLSLAF
jgi:hypothetical protein